VANASATAAVVVGLEWAHAESLSQGEGVLVAGFSLCHVWGIALCGDVAEEPQSPRLEAALFMILGVFEGTECEFPGAFRRPTKP
jgi:hypothetical protein